MDIARLVADILGPSAPKKKPLLDLSAVPSSEAQAGRLSPEMTATTPTTAEDLEALIRNILPETIGDRVAPVAGALADYGDPTQLLESIGLVPDMVNEWMTPDAPAPTLPSRDEFISSRRKPVPTYAEYEAAALDKVRSSKAYQDALSANRQTAARRLLDQERAAAKKNYETDKAFIEAQNNSIGGDYAKVQEDYDRELESYYGRSFADRNPITARQLPLMGALGAGLVTRGLLNKVRKPFNEAVDTLKSARKGSDPFDIAEAEKAVEAATPGKLATGGAFAAGAAVPVEIQMLADVIDAKGLDKEYQDSSGEWQPALAQQRAAKRLNPVEDPWGFAGNNSVAVLSGLLGAYGGSKFADPLKKLPGSPSPDDMRRAGDDIIAREAERARVSQATAARPQSPPGSGSGTSPGSSASPYSGQYKSYPSLPAEVRDDLRAGYAADVAASGSVPPAKAAAGNYSEMLKTIGVDAQVPARRVNAINKKVKDFLTQNGRMPTEAEIRQMFDGSTLALPVAVGGAAAMSDPDLEALLAEILGGGG